MVMAAILFKLDSPESDTDEEMMTMSKDDTSTCSVQAEGEVDNIDETCAQEKSPELATEVTRSTCALLLKRDLPQGNLTVSLGVTLKKLACGKKT